MTPHRFGILCAGVVLLFYSVAYAQVRVVDADTFWVDGIKYRLKAIDCPEAGTEAGDRATERLVKILGRGKPSCVGVGERSYDRTVAYCSVDGQDVGALLLYYSVCTVWEKFNTDGRY